MPLTHPLDTIPDLKPSFPAISVCQPWKIGWLGQRLTQAADYSAQSMKGYGVSPETVFMPEID